LSPPLPLAVDPNREFAAGRLLGLPTETVYGLAAPINRPDLIERIFVLKGRPPNHPLIVHVGCVAQARDCVSAWPALAERLATAFWPGPLTLVLPKAEHIDPRISAGQASVALRMPDHPLALAVLGALPVPLVAPSANRFTRLSPTCAADVRSVFDAADVTVVDGGPCRVGIESTIVAIDQVRRQVRLLRPGMLHQRAIAALLPPDWRLLDGGASPAERAPGQMHRHYRPDKPLRVIVADRTARVTGKPGQRRVVLDDDPHRAARDLYRSLRQAAAEQAKELLIVLPATVLDDPAWQGVVNRLSKAATHWERLES